MISMNADSMFSAIGAALDINRPLMIWGQPGCAKSDTMRRVTEARKAHLIDIRLSQYDSVDLRGCPALLKDQFTHWLPPITLPFEGNPNFKDIKGEIILFLDELPSAPHSVQAVAFQLVLDRCVGEHKLMKNVRVVAAGNRDGDRGVTNRMPTPLMNRFIHLEMGIELEPWITWAYKNEIEPMVIAFLRFRPDLLTNFDPKKSEAAFATPRTWEFASDVVKKVADGSLQYSLLAGCIGDGTAAEFTGFIKVWQNMPDLDKIIANPTKEVVPTDPATMYAVCAGLANKATAENFKAVLDYASRMKAEYRILMVKDALRRDQNLSDSKHFTKFAQDNMQLFGS